MSSWRFVESREMCEPTRKPSHATNYRNNKNGNETNISEISHSESHQRFYDHREKFPVITSAPKISMTYQKPITVVVPVRRPPPVPGPWFEVLKTGSCKAHIIVCCIYNHSAEALAAQIKKEQENVNTFLARSSDINDAIPASSYIEKGYYPAMLPVAIPVADEPQAVSPSTDVIINEISVESDIRKEAEQAVDYSIMLL